MIPGLLAKRIASAALTELEASSGEAMAGDKNNLATYYAERAYGDLNSHRDGFDPTLHATFRAEEAAVEYVKSRLVGQAADANAAYLRKKQGWAHKAAIEASEEYNENKKERIHFKDRM